MKVNYMVELNRLNRWEMTNPLNPTEYKLLLKLLDMANMEEFPDEIRVSSSLLKALVGCSEASLRPHCLPRPSRRGRGLCPQLLLVGQRRLPRRGGRTERRAGRRILRHIP